LAARAAISCAESSSAVRPSCSLRTTVRRNSCCRVSSFFLNVSSFFLSMNVCSVIKTAPRASPDLRDKQKSYALNLRRVNCSEGCVDGAPLTEVTVGACWLKRRRAQPWSRHSREAREGRLCQACRLHCDDS